MSHKTAGISKSDFLKSEKATLLRNELQEMADSPQYNTRVITLIDSDASYFVEKHMNYMSNHLNMDHSQYVKNIKLMTLITRPAFR